MSPQVRKGRGRTPVFRSVEGSLGDYLDGLGRAPKRLPCKLFYDDFGNRLFDRICEVEEYYPTRTELEILRGNAAEISGLAGSGVVLVEFGSGSPTKADLLLSHLNNPSAYIPVEISADQLLRSCEALRERFPGLRISPVCADYTRDFALPPLPAETKGVLLFFPGSTLGNFEPIDALAFLLKLAHLGGRGASLLIGIDLRKDSAVLEAAYNDSVGVTAAFNLNILARANREHAADFALERFRHVAFFEPLPGRIVMQLESTCEQEVRIAGHHFFFARGERIITEYSYKYGIGEFRALARLAGFHPQAVWTDPQELFSLHYLAVP
jgi:L-histidine Nalpha-methyltransferase